MSDSTFTPASASAFRKAVVRFANYGCHHLVSPTDFDRILKSEMEKELAKCCMCGNSLKNVLEGWRKSNVCSGRCWAELHGEEY
jgi:hypothetical protein